MKAGGQLAGGVRILKAPVDAVLTAAVRRLAKRRPDAFERLGPYEAAAFLVRADEAPLAFRLEPRRVGGRVTLVPRRDAGPYAAVISGPIADLLAVFDASGDADAAFFRRRVDIEGDTAAVVALHNALESAELSLLDLLPVAIDRGLARTVVRRTRAGSAWRARS